MRAQISEQNVLFFSHVFPDTPVTKRPGNHHTWNSIFAFFSLDIMQEKGALMNKNKIKIKTGRIYKHYM